MTPPIVERIVRASGMPSLLEFLSRRISLPDLQSLLLAVYQARAAQQTPARVLAQYERNRFVQPAAVDLRARLAVDGLALACAAPAFTALDLAPLCPLGTTSALGPVDQNTVVTTTRNTEVVSDCTNVLALECARRRRAARQEDAAGQQAVVRLCTSHRLVRAQNYNRPGLRAHFQIFALCSAGRAQAGYGLELALLREQLACYLTLLAALPQLGYPLPQVRVLFTDMGNPAFLARLAPEVIAPLLAQFPQVPIACSPEQVTNTTGYYDLLRFHIYARHGEGTELELADGGFTPWTARLLSDHKERLLISGIATERICTMFD